MGEISIFYEFTIFIIICIYYLIYLKIHHYECDFGSQIYLYSAKMPSY